MPHSPVKSTGDIGRLGTILSIWAHPDDESFCCAGLMAAAVANGQRVICVTATRGEKGIQDESRWPAARLAEIREAEMTAALRILGVSDHIFLDYADGDCDRVPLDEGRDQVLRLIKQFKPDTILTFGPDGMTGHTDHQSVSRWVAAAAQSLAQPPVVYHAVELKSTYEKFMKPLDEKFNIFFNINQPSLVEPADCDICFNCDSDLCQKKCAALKAMPSQTEALLGAVDEATMRAMLADEAFIQDI